jgi:hypothetical protein
VLSCLTGWHHYCKGLKQKLVTMKSGKNIYHIILMSLNTMALSFIPMISRWKRNIPCKTPTRMQTPAFPVHNQTLYWVVFRYNNKELFLHPGPYNMMYYGEVLQEHLLKIMYYFKAENCNFRLLDTKQRMLEPHLKSLINLLKKQN